MTEVSEPERRYVEYHPGRRCSAQGCASPAEFEVYLYDFYELPDGDEEFFEQDLTCPFLCESHVEENERLAKGERTPRSVVRYPHSNRSGAQGYTKYQPVSAVFPALYTGDLVLPPGLIATYQAVNADLLRVLASRPELLHELDPRRFEEVVAAIFRAKGFDVTLTRQTRDGGRDILAVDSSEFGTSLYLIECKRYAPHRKVGVEVVRGLYGVVAADRATKGIIATTSTFSRDAVAFANPLKFQMSLRDFESVRGWLSSLKPK
jgi:HJR/Mrr/RecB family endonuclease